MLKLAAAIAVLPAFTGCWGRSTIVLPPPSPRVALEDPVPGTVNGAWVEPMNDAVKVPSRLDPTGTYYLPEHEEIVEVRDGRFREATYGAKGGAK